MVRLFGSKSLVGTKSLGFLGALALGLSASPALAQDDGDPDAFAALFGAALTVDPLSDAEQARLPLARSLLVQMMPDGWYAKTMDQTIGSMLAPLKAMAVSSSMSVGDLMEATGLPYEPLSELSDADREAITATLDPVYGERSSLMMDRLLSAMTDIMGEMEPSLREAMSKAYARAFSEGELRDIAAFYATPTGIIFAEKSLLLSTDPQIMSASAKMAPLMMERMGAIFEQIENDSDALLPERGFEDLSAEEQSELANILGVSTQDLEESMTAQAQEWDDGEGVSDE